MKFTTQPQAQTLQQKMGFVDSDLTTPGHDTIMFWLDEQTTSTQLARWRNRDKWREDDFNRDFKNGYLIGRLREWFSQHKTELSNVEPSLLTARELFEAVQSDQVTPAFLAYPGFKLTRKQWEMPVMSGTYTIGFIDFVAHYEYPILGGTSSEPWAINWGSACMYFEVKTVIPSLGELLRQLGQYREAMLPHEQYGRYVDPSIQAGPMYVVSPDDRFATKIREQGYGFIQAPTV